MVFLLVSLVMTTVFVAAPGVIRLILRVLAVPVSALYGYFGPGGAPEEPATPEPPSPEPAPRKRAATAAPAPSRAAERAERRRARTASSAGGSRPARGRSATRRPKRNSKTAGAAAQGNASNSDREREADRARPRAAPWVPTDWNEMRPRDRPGAAAAAAAAADAASAAARRAKARGNAYFVDGDYGEAAECYGEAIDGCPADACERAVYYSNRAACRASIGGSDELVVDDCTVLSPASFPSSFFRRSECFIVCL